MANIEDITEAWAGHSGLEVETFLKAQLGALSSSLSGKFGYVSFDQANMRMVFYDYEGGTELGSVTLGGEVYTVDIQCNLPQVFYVLADETTKMMTITPSTTVAPFGSSQSVAFPEAYTFAVAVNTGNGYVPRITGDIEQGGSATFDIRPYLATGDNYIRVSVTGVSSHQARTIVFTSTLTTLTMSCSHTWQNVWHEGSDYVINGIRFAGNLEKRLHVSLDGVELDYVDYRANQSYTTTSTTYTIPASAFPVLAALRGLRSASSRNGVHLVQLWMTAQGVSTPVISYNIMCAADGDTTPMVAINAMVPSAVNYTSGTVFSYAVYLANKVSISMSATVNSVIYPVTPSPVVATGLEEGIQYQFAYSLEVDTGANEYPTGTLAVSATAYQNTTEGVTATGGTLFDNTYSYLATPGALFYLNAATRSNDASNYQTIVNEIGASADGHFAASYQATWNGLSWAEDGWTEDGDGVRALVIPAGTSVTFEDFAPLSFFTSPEYANSGMTIEMMIKSGNPSNYDLPVFSMYSGGATPVGIIVYPTKIVVWGSNERNEIKQSVMLSENRMTHLCVTFVKNYENTPTRNLCSIYVNGTSNVNFAYDGASTFGDGEFVIGQSDTDAYLYKMRVYGMALDSIAVASNFFNCIVDGLEFNRRENYNKNQVLDGTAVDYTMVKNAGYNTMVIQLTSDSTPLPSVDHEPPEDGWPDCVMKFEYAGHPAWNATVSGLNVDGQGTTSKKYFRWNQRGKTNSSTTWLYGDGTTAVGKVGKFINASGYIDIDRITAKKNYASSMQGHKMGMTGLYNDLFKQVGLGSHLPNSDYRVAVFQFPFVGFRYYEGNNSYEYIGLYTAGPDKNSKTTFGYDGDTYTKLLSIEGPNHDPLGTRFLVPWVDVTYDYEHETLAFGGEEGWDCDVIGGGLKTDKANNAAQVLALYEDEWKPAYEIVFHCSPHIAALSDALTENGYADIAAVNADIDNFRLGTTGGVKNSLLSFYDSNYDLWFYRTKTGQYENLTTVEGSNAHNVKTYLGLTGSPTTAQIKAARAAKFIADAPNYWDIDQTIYHYCFCVFFGVTDNFAKNSYPFKFRGYNETLGTGESVYCKRWGWRQDDLDTVLATDNNGRNTKPYYVEHGDLSNAGVELFQGGDSALWVLIRDHYGDAIRQMMSDIMTAMQAIAARNNITGDALHKTVFNVVSFYCWDKSAKYFSQTLYETDRRWAYLEPWLINPTKQYNNVLPLDQALGDEYQAERLWVERRIAYMFSKYRLGAFTGADTNYGGIAFTLAEAFTFHLTPAIELYPVGSVASTDQPIGTYSPDSMRTPAGVEKQLTIPAGGASTNYLHGGDWLSSLGDLSGMLLTDRSTGENISFSVQSERLQTLKVGDAVAGNVRFNAAILEVASPTVTTIDARNTATVNNIVDLTRCPRLRICRFAGSGATGLYLPVGAKLTEVSFPDDASTVFMHSLPFLQESGLTLPALAGITTLYLNNCAHINPFDLVADILDEQNETLQYATLIWHGIVTGDVDTVIALSQKNGRVLYDGTITKTAGKPIVEGMLSIPGMYADQLDELDIQSWEPYEGNYRKALSGLFGTNLYIIYNPNAVGIRFADANVEAICLANWDTDGNGVLSEMEAAAPTEISTVFRDASNKGTFTQFDEFRYFIGVTTVYGNTGTTGGAFAGCTALTKITIPMNVTTIGAKAFLNCSALVEMTFNNASNVYTFENYVFSGATNIARINIQDLRNWAYNYGRNNTTNHPNDSSTVASGVAMYLNGTLLENADFTGYDSVEAIRAAAFSNINSIKTVALNSPTMASGNFSIGDRAFYKCVNLTSITIPSNLTSIGGSAFNGCSNLSQEITLSSNVTSVGDSAFNGCSKLIKLVVPSSVSSLNSGTVHGASASVLDASKSILIVNCPFNLNGNGYGNIVFNRQYFGSSYTETNGYAQSGSNMMHVSIAGNYLRRATSAGFRSHNNLFSRLILLEFFGQLSKYASNSANLISSNWWQNITIGFMYHLGADSVMASPSFLVATSVALSKVYVGDGTSAAHDDAILALYQADSEWSASAGVSKLDTWYNYLHSGWTLDDQIAMGLTQGFVAVNKALTSTAATTYAFADVNGLCITDMIVLTSGHSYTYYVGDVPTTYKRVMCNQNGGQAATTGISATTFTADKYGCKLTVSMAAIQAGQAYMIDNTTGQMVWPNTTFVPNPHN